MCRVSRCGTDIGGDPTAALPYTLALWREETWGSSQRSHSPLTGNPAYPRPSGIPDFCNRGSDPPPPPMKTNLAARSQCSPVFSFLIHTFHNLPLRRRSMTRWKKWIENPSLPVNESRRTSWGGPYPHSYPVPCAARQRARLDRGLP